MKDPKYQEIKLLGGAVVQVDFSQRRVQCRKCKKLIRFGITQSGKFIPIIEKGDDYQSHFADCQFANDFRKNPARLDQELDEMEAKRDNFEE